MGSQVCFTHCHHHRVPGAVTLRIACPDLVWLVTNRLSSGHAPGTDGPDLEVHFYTIFGHFTMYLWNESKGE